MEQCFGVKYRLKSSTDNFDSYLQFIEIGFFSRIAAVSVSPVVTLTEYDGVYMFTVTTTLKTLAVSFRIGEQFVEERADGVKVKSIVTVEGNKMIQIQTEDCGRTSTHIREFTPDRLVVTTTADGWNGTCIRVYERV